MSHDHTTATKAITEVELSAVDLVGISSTDAAHPAARPARPTPQRALLGYRALGILGLVMIACAALIAHRVATSSDTSPRRTIVWTPLSETASDLFTDEDVPDGPPTLFTNPFDPTEVFELPPGLSEEEARERVAQILLERARERMANR